MLELDVRGLASVQRLFNDLAENQIPYAITVALNNTAFELLKSSKELLATKFNKPTPLVKKATRVETAKKETLTAKVLIDPKRATILKAHELGGARGAQRLERFLNSKGWLPSGWKAVPTSAMAVDAYGNPRRTEVNRVIAALDMGVSSARVGTRRWFVIPVGSTRSPQLKAGVYQANRRNEIKPLFIFVSSVLYRPMLTWEQTLMDNARQVLPDTAERAVQRALDTAR